MPKTKEIKKFILNDEIEDRYPELFDDILDEGKLHHWINLSSSLGYINEFNFNTLPYEDFKIEINRISFYHCQIKNFFLWLTESS